jgi:hypothetical protein
VDIFAFFFFFFFFSYVVSLDGGFCVTVVVYL